MKPDILSNYKEDYIPGTTQDAKSIKAIDKTTVHKICSGQVVLTLATAVKELVENSLDAGATNIDIKLRDYGSTLIEVCDNGKGVTPSDFNELTLKHHTSKILDFGDLVMVKTFGFRGEALSSLCALSNLSIITRHSSQKVGTKLEFDGNGKLLQQSPTSRQIGTSVILHNIFYSLPVRHKEFLRNLKKEFHKMIQILYSYCLISTDVRISCLNICDNGKKTVVVSTEARPSIKCNISSLFGAKQVSSLLEIKQKQASEDTLLEFGISNSSQPLQEKGINFHGFISSCAHGQGRSSPDRQFYFINSRPCDPLKVARIINDVYHSYNKNQFPVVVLNVIMKNEDVDVNVTPDKRQIFVNYETQLLATLKTTLVCLFENIPSTYVIQNLTPKVFHDSYATTSPKGKISELSKRFSSNFSNGSSNFADKTPGKLSGIKRSSAAFVADDRGGKKQAKLQDFSFVSNEDKNTTVTLVTKETEEQILPEYSNLVVHSENDSDVPKALEESAIVVLKQEDKPSSDNSLIKANKTLITTDSSDILHLDTNNHHFGTNNHSLSVTSQFVNPFLESPNNSVCIKNESPSSTTLSDEDFITNSNLKSSVPENDQSSSPTVPIVYEIDQMEELSHRVKSLSVSVSLLTIRQKLEERKLARSKRNNLQRKFRAKISPTENDTAEVELRREISKPMFKEMEIVGQFNLGFIITRLFSDLFVIDQHATDEKYNFETLQQTDRLQNQTLIIPQALQLTPVNEDILLDNLEIFNRNGFEFNTKEDQLPGHKVNLVSIPQSRSWNFGKEDIDELIFMLSDSPGMFCRPSRVRSMFASRACRKSVMIGTALDRNQMRKLVNHMGLIEQPWNCPHGRPTMRHLINLDLIYKSSS